MSGVRRSRTPEYGFPSKTVNFADCVGERLRRLLRQVVPDAALDDTVRVFAREFPGVDAGVRVWRAVGVAFKCDSGHGDYGSCGQTLLKLVILRLAFGQAAAMAAAAAPMKRRR